MAGMFGALAPNFTGQSMGGTDAGMYASPTLPTDFLRDRLRQIIGDRYADRIVDTGPTGFMAHNADMIPQGAMQTAAGIRSGNTAMTGMGMAGLALGALPLPPGVGKVVGGIAGDVAKDAGMFGITKIAQDAAQDAVPSANATLASAVSPTKRLSQAFNDAIDNHAGLGYADRAANSRAAIQTLAPHVGMRKDNTLVPLLGKNAKLMKAASGEGMDDLKPITLPDGRGVETTGLALAPAYQEGKFTTCPNSASCAASCLGKTSGNYFKLGGGTDLSAFEGPRLNSLKKTTAMLQEPGAFAVRLQDEIQAAKAGAAANGNQLGIRLNVLSDLNPQIHKRIIETNPDVAFYDYTKNNTDPIAPNHHYTYSSTGVSQPKGLNGNPNDVSNQNSNWTQMRKRLDTGSNVAMAFSHKDHLPQKVVDQETGKTYTVIDGDAHDFRPMDATPDGEDGVIVGLKNKKATGSMDNAALDSNGFFVHYDPGLKKTDKGTFERGPSPGISPNTGKPMLGSTIPTVDTVHIAPQIKAPKIKTNDQAQ